MSGGDGAKPPIWGASRPMSGGESPTAGVSTPESGHGIAGSLSRSGGEGTNEDTYTMGIMSGGGEVSTGSGGGDASGDD